MFSQRLYKFPQNVVSEFSSLPPLKTSSVFQDTGTRLGVRAGTSPFQDESVVAGALGAVLPTRQGHSQCPGHARLPGGLGNVLISFEL